MFSHEEREVNTEAAQLKIVPTKPRQLLGSSLTMALALGLDRQQVPIPYVLPRTRDQKGKPEQLDGMELAISIPPPLPLLLVVDGQHLGCL